MSDSEFILTRAGYNKLKIELDKLLNEEIGKAAERLAEAHEDEAGDEANFYAAKVNKERLDARAAHLKLVLAQAEIIEEDPDPESVSPGNRVTVLDIDEKEELVFDLLGSTEIANVRKGVSINSPVGKALLGQRVGDKVEVEVPVGIARYKIRKIEMIPDDE